MLKKGFLSDQRRRSHGERRAASPLTSAMLYLGMLVLIVSLVYILLNLERADEIVNYWLVFVFVGLFLVVVSQFIKRWHQRRP